MAVLYPGKEGGHRILAMVKPEIQQQVIVTIKNRHNGLLGYQVVKMADTVADLCPGASRNSQARNNCQRELCITLYPAAGP
ncbi:hypothetical protein NUKP16_10320 [Klebsiella quasipneumoniae]|nr:hypothetical protein NUKP16_10320 [Klebsiella quasipneumoniae]GKQ04133.1 hypothetical protein NUKP771_27120 [Klebsiella quasipneumoniae]